MKDNPKHIQAMKDGKAPLEYLVSTMDELDAAVHKHGADKYGVLNWRIDEITAKTYVGAMRRHLKEWAEGRDIDPESGKPHLTHLRACCAVVLDAQMFGKLIDNRLEMESKSVKAAQPPAPGAGSVNLDAKIATDHQVWCASEQDGALCDCKMPPKHGPDGY